MANIRKRKGNKWQVQIRRHDHEPIYKTFTHRADALAWGRIQEARIDRADIPNNLRDLKRKKLGDLLVRYRSEVTPRKRSARHESYRLRRLLDHPIASLTLAQLSSSHIASFRDDRLIEVGPQAVRHDLNLLGHVIRTASQEWGIGVPPDLLSHVTKPKLPEPRTRRLYDGEMGRIEDAGSGGVRPPFLLPLIRAAIETALRKSELLSLEWREIDLERRTARITRTKNGHPRTIPLSGKAIEALTDQRGVHAERVFPVTVPALRFHWDRLLSDAGISDLHFHDLRHEAISRLFEKGLSIPEVALISGHRDYRQLFRYTHLRAEDLVKKL